MYMTGDGVWLVKGGEERRRDGGRGREKQISSGEMSGLRGDGWC